MNIRLMPGIRRHCRVTMILCGGLLVHASSAAAFNFGDMMNPNRWFGGDRYDYGPGYDLPPPPPPPPAYGYGTPYGYGAPGYAAPYGYAPPATAPAATGSQSQASEEKIRQLERRIKELESQSARSYQPQPVPYEPQPAPVAPAVPGARPPDAPSSAIRELPADMVFRPLDAQSIP